MWGGGGCFEGRGACGGFWSGQEAPAGVQRTVPGMSSAAPRVVPPGVFLWYWCRALSGCGLWGQLGEREVLTGHLPRRCPCACCPPLTQLFPSHCLPASSVSAPRLQAPLGGQGLSLSHRAGGWVCALVGESAGPDQCTGGWARASIPGVQH